MMNLRPLGDRLVVRRIAPDEVSKGGIIIPEAHREKPLEGDVLAVGPGKQLENGTVRPMTVKLGDRILFGRYSAIEAQREGEVLFIREEEVLAVVDG